MKIIFICGSLEPGRDGVGDYTRRLAGELIRQGHDAAIVALKDRFANQIISSRQKISNIDVPTLRIPYILSDKTRISIVNEYIADFNPEWISWQFVIYAYQKKGLPFGLPKQIKQIETTAKRQMMFHEIWVGIDREAPFRFRIYGILQKYIIRKILHALNPEKILTQATLHRQMLELLTAKKIYKLPLFGNIPVSIISEEKIRNENRVIMVVFGSIYHGTDVSGFADWLCRERDRLNKDVEIQFIGKNGQELEKWINILSDKNVPCKIYGRQNEETISKVLQKASIGLGTTPFPLIEKSGSIAAMLEHNLPVLCLARKWTTTIDIQIDSPVIEWSDGLNLNELLYTAVDRSNNAERIAMDFITQLQS
jgi:hypothetical protein